MANPEHSHHPEQVHASIFASEFYQVCESYATLTSDDEIIAARQKLVELATSHAKGTAFVAVGVQRELERYGNEPGQHPMSYLPDAVEIDPEANKYGIFSEDGAKKFEQNYLSFLLPKVPLRRQGFPAISQHEDRELRQQWVESYEIHYGESVDRNENILFRSGF